MVLASHDVLGNTSLKTGFWLEEFAAPSRRGESRLGVVPAMPAEVIPVRLGRQDTFAQGVTDVDGFQSGLLQRRCR